MDKRIRLSEKCVIGLPRCDFAFSSTRCCFIAYPFEEAGLEVGILKRLLEEKGIQAVEAGGQRAPGQSAFCAKICSKIITSQFCIVILNNRLVEGVEIPNPNVNMEYGLMLGFNKYVIPCQLASQSLAFNVAGLDTIKYTSSNFERLANGAIEQAIRETEQQHGQEAIPLDQVLQTFLIDRGVLISPITNDGERDMYNLGAPLGYYLLVSFSGMSCFFLGNFAAMRTEVVLWRIRKLDEIIAGRRSSFIEKLKAGMATEDQVRLASKLFDELAVWVVVTSDADRTATVSDLTAKPPKFQTLIITLDEVNRVQERFGPAASV